MGSQGRPILEKAVSGRTPRAIIGLMDKQIRKPRIGDVAERAGVSTATVSRTLATPDRVTPKTRDAVMRAVRETGYVLNLAARNLRTSRTHAVLAVLPDASNIFFSQVLRGISDTLHRHGYSLVIADTAMLAGSDDGSTRSRSMRTDVSTSPRG